jgi:hypothetical protein
MQVRPTAESSCKSHLAINGFHLSHHRPLERPRAVSETHHIELRYVGGAADIEELDAEISLIFEELTDPDSEVSIKARAAGFNLFELAGSQARVSKVAKGFGLVVLLVAIASPAATHILETLWDEIVLPQLKKRLGADAIGTKDPNERERG